jgi:hypothetical protein
MLCTTSGRSEQDVNGNHWPPACLQALGDAVPQEEWKLPFCLLPLHLSGCPQRAAVFGAALGEMFLWSGRHSCVPATPLQIPLKVAATQEQPTSLRRSCPQPALTLAQETGEFFLPHQLFALLSSSQLQAHLLMLYYYYYYCYCY